MNAPVTDGFEAELKRAFAEGPGFDAPADDGFSARVSRRVARAERAAAARRLAHIAGYAAAAAAAAFGLAGLAPALDPQMYATVEADMARAYGGLSQFSAMGAGLTQVMMVLAAAAGAAVAVRASQD